MMLVNIAPTSVALDPDGLDKSLDNINPDNIVSFLDYDVGKKGGSW